MQPGSWGWLLTWDGRVNRRQYFWTGATLIAVKYVIDRTVAAYFGETWQVWNYFLPNRDVSLLELGHRRPELYGVLWAIAIPFFWIGIVLTLRRLRDAGKPTGWVFLFFVPVANLALFLWLTLAPSAPEALREESTGAKAQVARSSLRIVLGIGFAVVLGVMLVILSTQVLLGYAWGLFLGVPFLIGFVSSWFLNSKSVASRLKTVGVSVLATLLTGSAIFGLRLEGLVCLLMAVPLALPFSCAGGLVAWHILRGRNRPTVTPTFAAGLAILPLLMFVEHAARVVPPVVSVTTSITIDAPVSTVWKNVIAFSPLPPPKEGIFRTGIAYPTSAQIIGAGRGAIRYCRFSTGDFVEPITVWDENRLLAFDVASQPQSMRELSLWRITPPHLQRDYMRSRRGQFRLVALDGRHTLLEGTTWYQDYFWPQWYWRAWSDAIVRRIHLRVLHHVQTLSEAGSSSDAPTETRESSNPKPSQVE